ncbi:helix-turn-helix domain-containing protein [Algoriphagus taiwanensis]|uniref:HTH araC/xylS-type domain-containing protein n=1 Tax=Algoriphagus taiwanensis TaxID=1445656 RepID=A0ABQ6Q4I7_9BACT|nr:hypothetical protein Ataiwa_33750 [Algoriphagus taiwanensis]
MRFVIFFLIFLVIFLPSFGQDTLFTAKHSFSTPVRNVFEANGEVYVKTGDKLYQLEGNEWEELEITFQKPYVFFKEQFYESDFIPNSKLFDTKPIQDLIPQRGVFIATGARKGDRLFISIGSSLFEYEIRPHYTKTYHNKSIRDIYWEPGLKVVSTYSGIFVNDSILLDYPTYTNGPMVRIENRYFLPWDELSEFFPPDSSVIIPDGTSPFAGKARKILRWKGDIYSMNTLSVSKVEEEFTLHPIHQGDEYLDMEIVGDQGILISTISGTCLLWDGEKIYPIAQIPSRIRDIYVAGQQVFLASDLGVYVLDELKQETISLEYSIPYSVALQIDGLGNLWIASENGLYVVDEEFGKDPFLVIPQVEFNRDAIFLKEEILYAGAVDGLYQVNTYEIKKEFIPGIAATLTILDFRSKNAFWALLGGIFILGMVTLVLWRKYYGQKETGTLIPLKNELTLEDFRLAILENNLSTVDSIAEKFDTNTVQLNRIFKNFDTTPGKYLKKIKLELASKLLSEGMDIEEISKKTGYSTAFIKKELIK